MKKLSLYILILFNLLSLKLFSQISGVVNTYAPVVNIDYPCNKLTIGSISGYPAPYASGDRVLIIQMQGATMDNTNSSSFGNLTAVNNSGNYEINVISGVVGSDIYLRNTILKNYTVTGAVQLVRIPQYTDVSVNGTLTSLAWDGSVGGVIIIEASGKVTLNANVDASGKGFRGGDPSLNGGDCRTSSDNTYYYAFPTVQAGKKGEGIAGYVASRESGRGKNVNGGGGGNSHNSGGGGGANYGSGGIGGNRATNCISSLDGIIGPAPNPYGFGGVGLSTTYSANSKVFAGGGGGGGQQNNNKAFGGGNGGGIIIIRAAILEAVGFGIVNTGNSVAENLTDHGDGNGGGGAGGTVLLDVPVYNGFLPVNVSGGNGGWTNNYGSNQDFGPGGGGGGGVVLQTSTSTQVSSLISGGLNGTSRKCNCANNSTPGTNGGVLTHAIQIATVPFSPACQVFPVVMLNYFATKSGKTAILTWSTAQEKNNQKFIIEKSLDGLEYVKIGEVNGKGNTLTISNYTFSDYRPASGINYYRLSQIDNDGKQEYLGVRDLSFDPEEKMVPRVYPVPFKDLLHIDFNSQIQMNYQIRLLDGVGKIVFEDIYAGSDPELSLELSHLAPGLYFLQITGQEQLQVERVLKIE